MASSLPAEIPLYHILNARITFSNLNGCEEGTGARTDNEVAVEGEGQRDAPRTDTPSPGSDSSSVSSSSSTSENTLPHIVFFYFITVSSFLTSSASAEKGFVNIYCRTWPILHYRQGLQSPNRVMSSVYHWCRMEGCVSLCRVWDYVSLSSS